MKVRVTHQSGAVVEVEGTPEELAQVLPSILPLQVALYPYQEPPTYPRWPQLPEVICKLPTL